MYKQCYINTKYIFKKLNGRSNVFFPIDILVIRVFFNLKNKWIIHMQSILSSTKCQRCHQTILNYEIIFFISRLCWQCYSSEPEISLSRPSWHLMFQLTNLLLFWWACLCIWFGVLSCWFQFALFLHSFFLYEALWSIKTIWY